MNGKQLRLVAGAEEDVVALQAEGLAWVLPGAERGQKVVFAREQPPMISVSTDVLKMWHEVEVGLPVFSMLRPQSPIMIS